MDENSNHITFPHTLECQINRGGGRLIKFLEILDNF